MKKPMHVWSSSALKVVAIIIAGSSQIDALMFVLTVYCLLRKMKFGLMAMTDRSEHVHALKGKITSLMKKRLPASTSYVLIIADKTTATDQISALMLAHLDWYSTTKQKSPSMLNTLAKSEPVHVPTKKQPTQTESVHAQSSMHHLMVTFVTHATITVLLAMVHRNINVQVAKNYETNNGMTQQSQDHVNVWQILTQLATVAVNANRAWTLILQSEFAEKEPNVLRVVEQTTAMIERIDVFFRVQMD